MFCHKCGNRLVNAATFCSYCGTKVEFPSNNSEPTQSSTEVSLDKEHYNMIDNHSETTSYSTIEESNTKLNSYWEKIKSYSKTVFWFILVLILGGLAKAVGRTMARSTIANKDLMLLLSYAIPGFIVGLLFAIIPAVILKKKKEADKKKNIIIFIFNGLLGLYGGIPFALGGAIILSLIVVFIQKNK